MNMQQLMQQAQKMQRDLQKKQNELNQKVFTIESAGGAIKIEIKGSKEILSINIDKDAIDPDDKEMLEDMLKIAINEAISTVDQASEAINSSITNGLRF